MYQVLKPTEESFEIAGKALRDGRLVVAPTYTVYAIVCDAFNEQALGALRRAQGSPADKPITVVMDGETIARYASITEREQRIIDVLLPAPVCVFVNKRESRLDLATTYSDAVSVFWQDSEIEKLYNHSGTVLALTSANRNGLPVATIVQEAIDYFGDAVDVYIDGGGSRGNYPNAQIDIRTRPVKFVREAPHFSADKIKSILAEHGLE